MTKKVLFIALLSLVYATSYGAAPKSGSSPIKFSKLRNELDQRLPVQPLQQIVIDYLGDIEDKWEKVQVIPHIGGTIALSPDGSYLAINPKATRFGQRPHKNGPITLGTDIEIFKLNEKTYERIETIIPDEEIKSIVFSNDNNYLVLGDKSGYSVLELVNGQYKPYGNKSLINDFIGATFSRNGDYFIVDSPNTCFILNLLLVNKGPQEYKPDYRLVGSSMSFDNQYIALRLNRNDPYKSAVVDTIIQLIKFNKDSGEFESTGYQLDDPNLFKAKFVSNNRFATLNFDKQIKIYNFINGEFKLQQKIETTRNIKSISFTQDGKYLAIGQENKSEIFEFKNGIYIHKQDLDTSNFGENFYVEFSADGTWLISASDMGDINIWKNTRMELES